MQFTKSDWKVPPNIEAAQKKVAAYPGANNLTNFVHFLNARPDNTNYKPYGIIRDKDKQQLVKEGKCLFCKQPRHLAKDCPKKNISSSTIQVRY